MSNAGRGRYIYDSHPAQNAEALRLKLLAEQYASSTAALISRLKLTGSETILDAGCGLGGPLQAFAETTTRHTVGCDLSIELLKKASIEIAGRTNIRLICGDMSNLPFADESFDLVYSRFALKHVYSPARAVAELSRVLRVGGRLCVIDKDMLAALSLWYPPFSLSTLSLFKAINMLNRNLNRGGNANIGRTLKRLCTESGLKVTSVNLECCPMTPGDGSDVDFHRCMYLSVYRNNLPILVDKGLISYDEGEADLKRLEEFLCREDHFAATINFIVLAEKNQ